MSAAAQAAPAPEPRRVRAALAENLAVSVALGAMVVLPLAESLLRAAFQTGISGATVLVQHLTLVVGMLGGAVAARENRLLSLATGAVLPHALQRAAAFAGKALGAAVCVLLAAAGTRFVLTEKEAGNILVYGLPVWVAEAVIPAGFGLVAWRLVRQSGDGWKWRAAAAVVAAAVPLCAMYGMVPAKAVAPALLVLVGATVLGLPLFATLGGATLVLLWGAEIPIASAAVDHYRLVTNPSLPAIPLFTLAGYFLAEGGASTRLIRVFQALFGSLRGGPAVVTVLVCAFFTTFTGASGVTILALGGLLMPVLLSAGYSERNALGLLTGAGSLGLLFPPCLPLILYAVIAKVDLSQMFLGGLLPGALLVALAGWWGVRAGPRAASSSHNFSAAEAGRALNQAKWDLLLPVVALAGIFGGFATPVEAAAMTALYAFAVQTFVYRTLNAAGVLRVTTECALVVGGVLLILGVALGFTNYLVFAEIPTMARDWVTAAVESPLVFLLLLNLFLLVVGCLMDIFSAILIVVPLIVPIGEAFGIHPVHLGIVFLANMELGYLTPPVGMNLFLASYRLGKPMSEVYRSVVPMLLVLFAGVLLVTYIPALTTALPDWFAGAGAP